MVSPHDALRAKIGQPAPATPLALWSIQNKSGS